jgi:hypothetical protein
VRRAVLTLVAATALIAWMSELLVGAVSEASHVLGLTEVFVGVVVVAVVGNAAEHSTAVLVAMKDHMDLALNIAIGSSIQIALFVAPVLVFASYAMPHGPMDLRFTPFEVLAVVAAVGVVNLVAQDGESNWLEGRCSSRSTRCSRSHSSSCPEPRPRLRAGGPPRSRARLAGTHRRNPRMSVAPSVTNDRVRDLIRQLDEAMVPADDAARARGVKVALERVFAAGTGFLPDAFLEPEPGALRAPPRPPRSREPLHGHRDGVEYRPGHAAARPRRHLVRRARVLGSHQGDVVLVSGR